MSFQGVTFDGTSTTELESVVSNDEVTVTTQFFETIENGTILRYGVKNRIDDIDGTNITETNGIFRPPLQDQRFTLAAGESASSSTNQFSDIGGDLVNTGSVTYTYTYIGRQSVSVDGRNFDTCHFEIEVSSAGRTFTRQEWRAVGSGAAIRSEDDESVTETISGSINGSPI